jgi:hypothetical protein
MYLFEQVKDDMAYMLNTESDWVTSEGMSYGIMIAAQVGPVPLFHFSFSRYFRDRATSGNDSSTQCYLVLSSIE